MIRGVLFDLDGTLIDSAPELSTSLNAALVELGLEPIEIDEARSYIGDGLQRFVKRGITRTMWDNPDEQLLKTGTKIMREHYADSYLDRDALYPGARSMLVQLAAQGFELGVVTNKPSSFARPIVDKFMPDTFGVVIGGDDGPCKPDPQPLVSAASMLGIPVDSCVMVGDSQADARASHAAGCAALVIVTYGYAGRIDIADLKADFYAGSLAEACSFIGEITSREMVQ